MNSTNEPTKANKTDAGNGSKAICRVINAPRSPAHNPSRWPINMTDYSKLIPSTATNIRVTNDLDLNTSEGSFSFQPSESAAFTGLLHRLDASSSSRSHLEDRQTPGAIAHRYSDGTNEWTFLVSPDSGHCDYYMMPKQAAHTP